MGCWNETCAISGLPILEKHPARMVVLRQEISGSPYEEWGPVGFSIKGVYNNYGALKEYGDDVFTQHLTEILKANTKTGSEHLDTLSDFVSALQYNESLRWVSGGREGRMGLALVREDIYRVVIGFGSPTVRQQANRYWSILGPFREGLEKTDQQRLISLFLTAPNDHGRFLIDPERYLQWDTETRQEVFDHLLEDMMVSDGMWSLRKSWAVGLPTSQVTDFDAHALYHETVARIANELHEKD